MLSEMAAATGAPLRVRDLAALTGFTKPKIMADIRQGYLGAAPVRCGQSCMWLVPFAEAQRYLRALHLL